MAAVTATQARRDFFGMIQRVAGGDGPVEVVSKHGNVMVVSAAEYESLAETAYLLSTPANADRLRRSLADARAGRVEAHELPQL